MTVSQFKASPPASGTVEIVGYVNDTYVCPPCPKGTQCKPCASPSAIFIADRLPSGEERMHVREIGIAADPAQFEPGVKYRLNVEVINPRGEIVGRVVSSEPVR